jgi:hypothetical protein
MVKADLIKIIIPTRGQVVISGLSSLLLFAFIFRDSLIFRHLPSEIVDTPYLRESYLSQLNRISNLQLTDVLIKGLFWAGLGLVAYLVFLFISNIVIEARNQVVVETEYTNQERLENRLRKPLLQVAAAASFILVLAASVNWLLPVWLGLFGTGALSVTSLGGVLRLVLALVAGTINFYLLWALAEIVFAID